MPIVAVVGASTDRNKFGNKSLRAHLACGYEAVPIHPKAELIEGQKAYPSIGDAGQSRWDRITVYLPPARTLNLLDELATVEFDELWLNPGTEDDAVREKAESLGISPTYGCSIVELGVSPADFP